MHTHPQLARTHTPATCAHTRAVRSRWTSGRTIEFLAAHTALARSVRWGCLFGWLFDCLFVCWSPSPRQHSSPTLFHHLVALGSPGHICAGTRLTPPTSTRDCALYRPHLRRDWARPTHLCTGTGLTPPASEAGQGSARPHRHERRRPIAPLRFFVCLPCAPQPKLLACRHRFSSVDGPSRGTNAAALRVSGLGARP